MRAKAFAIVAAFVVLMVTGCGTAPLHVQAPRHADSPVRIVVLGDSLGLGTGASGPASGFTFDIFRRLARERPGSSISDYAIGGARIADVLRLEAPRLRGEHADLVLIVVGGNDVVRTTGRTAFARTYAQLLDTIAMTEPKAAIVACGVPDVAISPIFIGSDIGAIGRLSRDDDRAVHRAAARRNIPVVDLFSISQQARGELDTFLSADRFHPSDLGYRRIAAAAYPMVIRALRERRG